MKRDPKTGGYYYTKSRNLLSGGLQTVAVAKHTHTTTLVVCVWVPLGEMVGC